MTNSAIRLIPYAVRIFLSLLTGTVTLTCFVYKIFLKPFKCKSFFQNSILLDKKVEKQKLSFQNRNSYNIKIKKFLFATLISSLHLQSVAFSCRWK